MCPIDEESTIIFPVPKVEEDNQTPHIWCRSFPQPIQDQGAFQTLVAVSSDVWTYVFSIKYRLIMKLIVQLATNLRDESFKPNQFMI